MAEIDIASIASNAAIGFSGIVVAFFAWRGLSAWRGKARFEAARKVRGLSRQFVSEFQGERLTRTLDLYKPAVFEKSRRALERLQEAGWDAEALLKGDIEDCIRQFIIVFNDVSMGTHKLLQRKGKIWLSEANGQDEQKVKAEVEKEDSLTRKVARIVGDDEVTKALDKAASALDDKLRPYINPQPWWRWVLRVLWKGI